MKTDAFQPKFECRDFLTMQNSIRPDSDQEEICEWAEQDGALDTYQDIDERRIDLEEMHNCEDMLLLKKLRLSGYQGIYVQLSLYRCLRHGSNIGRNSRCNY